MTETGYFNDTPILTPEDDRFGIDPFAQALAQSLRNMRSPIGVAIAINGAWGSGKSSAVNLIRYHLGDSVQTAELEIIDFRCWWFRGEEALTLAFLQELNACLRKNLADKAKDLIPRLGKALLQTGPVVGPAINLATTSFLGTLVSGSMDFAKKFFKEGENIEKLFESLSRALNEQNKRFLVIVDDIDRLAPSEAVLIFRLIKSVGRLPNVMYLLVFDRVLAEKSVNGLYPSEGPHFLEKIIQGSFELPLPGRDDLNAAAMSQIETLCSLPHDKDQVLRFMNVFYDAVSPYLNTPRDIARLSNAMAVSWPAVAGEVDVGDYVALEIMKLFEPVLYNAIRTSKDDVCGVRSEYGSRGTPEEELDKFLKLVSDKNRDYAKPTLIRLFPRFENVGYSQNSIDRWEAERRVCVDKHFDTYFRMGIGDETISLAEVHEFISRATDGEYVRQTFRTALNSIRKNGKSKVPLLLDELNVHAPRIEKEKLQPLITAIFEIADDIDREEDGERGGFSYGDNQLRIHWLIRKLTLEKCDLKERTALFLAACENAQVGWLVDFTSSAVALALPDNKGKPAPENEWLISSERISDLTTLAIKAIKRTDDGRLILHPRLPSILFFWGEFGGDDGVHVKTWTAEQLKSDEAVALLAKAFTGETWSQGIGMVGLGDRVAMRNVRASISGLERVMDINQFRRRLEELENKEALDDKNKENIRVFLQAWRKQETGNGR